jgi:hypothetical protein
MTPVRQTAAFVKHDLRDALAGPGKGAAPGSERVL